MTSTTIEQPPRPIAPTIKPENIPRALTQLRQWVMWRYRFDAPRGKWTKVPYQPSGQKASTTDAATWVDYKTALAALAPRSFGAFDGIGFVLRKADPFCGVDLDHCIENGKLSAWAQHVVSALDSYTEITPSGEGLRIFVRAKLKGGGRKNGRIEIYDDVRFLTITGQVWTNGVENRAAAKSADEHLS